MMPLKLVRRAEPEDTEAISELWVEWCKEHDPDSDPHREAWLSPTVMLVKVGSYIAAVVSLGPVVVGFSDGMLVYEPATRVIQLVGRTVYIRPEHRQEGLCEGLYRVMVNNAREKGASEVLTHGEPSKHIYETLFPGSEMTHHMTVMAGAIDGQVSAPLLKSIDA